MELTGELKKKVEQAETKEEAREIVKEAGMLLSDEELDEAAGGGGWVTNPTYFNQNDRDPNGYWNYGVKDRVQDKVRF